MRPISALRRASGGRSRGRSKALRLGATAVAAVILAEAAVWLLRPRDALQGPAVRERSYFSEAEIRKAESYRSDQELLFLGTLVIEAGALLLLAGGRPAVVRRLLERAGRSHPVRNAALAGAGLSLGLAVLTLPFGIAAYERSVDAGLSTQSHSGWALDRAKSAVIAAALAAGGAALAIWLMRRFPRRWWLGATAAVIGFEVVFVYLAPVVLAPLFEKFTALPPGPVRSEVFDLGRRAGVDIGQVYRVDASRRSTALNAYVDGIGATKRVVLYDNLINGADRPELASVVAHELGHVHANDVPRGMLWVALVAPLSILFVSGASEALARRSGAEPGTPASLPALFLVLGATALVIGTIGNQLSRVVEARADTFALELTNDPKAMISLQRKLTVRNLSDPNPPGVIEFLLGTHPPAVDRIGAAVAWQEGKRP